MPVLGVAGNAQQERSLRATDHASAWAALTKPIRTASNMLREELLSFSLTSKVIALAKNADPRSPMYRFNPLHRQHHQQ